MKKKKRSSQLLKKVYAFWLIFLPRDTTRLRNLVYFLLELVLPGKSNKSRTTRCVHSRICLID